jgi:hypothetical protein
MSLRERTRPELGIIDSRELAGRRYTVCADIHQRRGAADRGEHCQAAGAVADGSARGKRLPAARVVGNTDMICIHHF